MSPWALWLLLCQAGPALPFEGHFALDSCAWLSWKDGSSGKCQGKLLVDSLEHSEEILQTFPRSQQG